MTNTELDKVEKQIEQLRNRRNAIKARQRKAEKKRDTQRKVVVGATLMKHANLHPEFQQVLFDILNQHVNRPYDRDLLGLDPLQEDTATTSDT